MKRVFTLLFVVTALFYGCTEQSNTPANNGIFEGYIVTDDNSPLSDAMVAAMIEDETLDTDTTDSEGHFLLSGLPENRAGVILHLSHPEHAPKQVILKYMHDSLKTDRGFEIKMKNNDSCCGRIEVIVKDTTDGSFIKNAEVRLNKGKDVIKKHKTNESGIVDFDNVCPDNYRMLIAAEGYNVLEKELSMGDCDTLRFTERLSPKAAKDTCCGGILKILPKDAAGGEALNGALVKIWKNGKLKEKLEVKEGAAIFDGLCEGVYGFDIIKSGYKHFEFEVELGCNEVKEIEKNLEKELCCGFINTKVTGEDSTQAIENAEIKLIKGNSIIEKSLTGKSGLVQFSSICEGEYLLRIAKEGYKVIEKEFKFNTDCDTLDLRIKLEKQAGEDCCGVFIARVKDKDGSPVKEAEVKLTLGEKKIKLYTNADGYVIFEELCPGKYGVRIFKNGYVLFEEGLNITDCDPLENSYKLEKKGDDCCEGKVYLLIKDKNGNKLRGGKIKLLKEGTLIAQENFDTSGVWFDELCKGKYSVGIIHEGYGQMEFTFELGCNETKEFVKKLENDCCKGNIKVIVRDSLTNLEIENAKVRIWEKDKMLDYAKTKGGVVLIDNICEGEYTMDIVHQDYKVPEFEVKIECDKTTEIEKYLIKK
ncbi:MAG: collagen binding domain-containing protein [Candidatus Kapaibacterium sp.]